MRFAPSDAQNAFWSEATTAFNEGRTVMMPHMYNGLWSWANDVEKLGNYIHSATNAEFAGEKKLKKVVGIANFYAILTPVQFNFNTRRDKHEHPQR